MLVAEQLDWDVIILGGGAAGLFAAIRAGERGARVLVLEKNRRPGVKILMSGGTRCNLTNARGLRSLRAITGPIDPGYDPRQAQGARSIQHAFGEGGAFLGPSLKALSVDQTVSMFEAEGLPRQGRAERQDLPRVRPRRGRSRRPAPSSRPLGGGAPVHCAGRVGRARSKGAFASRFQANRSRRNG